MSTHGRPDEELVCRELVELVTDYLEGTLPAGSRRRLEDHLRECPYCVEYVEQMRSLGDGLAGAGRETIDDARRDALIAAFRDLRGA